MEVLMILAWDNFDTSWLTCLLPIQIIYLNYRTLQVTHVITDGILAKNVLDTHVHKPDDVPLAVTTVVEDPGKKEKSLMGI